MKLERINYFTISSLKIVEIGTCETFFREKSESWFIQTGNHIGFSIPPTRSRYADTVLGLHFL